MVVDPIRLEVFHHLLAAVCEESGALLQRTAISPNIRERRDFSCALFDGEGRLIAQAAHIPVHLGSAAESVRAVVRELPLRDGDVALLNDPYAGGTHLPDLTMVRPIFVNANDTAPSFFAVNRAHHADIGGAVPGSMGVAGDLIAEGLVLPPIKLRTAAGLDTQVLRLIRANVRGAAERMVDLQAQEASLRLAETRIRELVAQQGLAATVAYCRHLMDYSERIVRTVLRGIPDGEYRACDTMDDDGLGNGPFTIDLRLRKRRGGLAFDFRGSDPQAAGGINANRSIVLAACVYVLRCLCPGRLPTNEGLFRRLTVQTTPGTLVDPLSPAPVAGGNVETSQRLVDVVLQAFTAALPDVIPADSAGTMSNVTLGNAAFAFYETLPGGAGGGPRCAGTSAVQTHMTNTRNTPVEEMEQRYPVHLRKLTVRRGSGGRGRHRGGDGVVKEIELEAPAQVSLFADRHVRAPAGRDGGKAGKSGRAFVEREGRRRRVPAKGSLPLHAGDVLVIETPGGGGWGRG
ncbi:MAG: hydantoinase B/oxoprolinase family protein [Planctomycetes bacterium]|nr:hydantoinase B/oxoprolinase family protein [Planctomycetota bacterium]